MNPLTCLAVALLACLVVAPFILLRRRKVSDWKGPETPADMIEANYAHAHGMCLQDWRSLTPNQRRDLRNNVAHAVNRRPTTAMPCRCSKCMQALIAYKRSS